MLGTARYASPEQARGLSVDGKTDVYSLALSLVESMTGQVPFAADTTVATLQARIDKLMPVSAEMGPLAAVLERSGRPNPAERFDSSELGKALILAAERLPRPQPLPLVALLGGATRGEPTQMSPSIPPSSIPNTPIRRVDPRPPRPSSPSLGGPTSLPARWSQRPASRAPRRRWPWVILVLVLLGGAGVGAVVVLKDQRSIRTYPVQSFKNLNADQVANLVSQFHWTVSTALTRLDNTTAGQIVSQTPKEKEKLVEGGTLTIVVSQGPTLAPVPDLSKLLQPAAESALHTAGFKLGKVTPANDESTGPGTVIDWTLKGQTLEKGATVDLTVSSGPAMRTIPAVAGQPFATVNALLSAASPGLQLSVQRQDAFDPKIKAETVIATQPAEGQQIARDQPIVVIVSKGPELVSVPDLTGKSIQDAVTAIRAIGLKDGNSSGPAAGRVVSSSPAAGTQVPKGSRVDIRTA